MKFLKHLFENPFISATGAAALVHSTWALATLFAGEQPEGIWHLLGWLLPALLIAFALDVGQIATSAEIREHGLSFARGVTFLVFSGATYYLQWLYIAHHMPALELAPGISEIAHNTAVYMRDAALWLIPALLPLSTLLYTFSGGKRRNQPVLRESEAISENPPKTVEIARIEPIALPDLEQSAPLPFGDTLPALEDGENTRAMPPAKKRIASANGTRKHAESVTK